jgi:Flp pilus assembly protein TadB
VNQDEQRAAICRDVARVAAGSGQIDVDVAAQVAWSTLDYIDWPASVLRAGQPTLDSAELDADEYVAAARPSAPSRVAGVATSLAAYAIVAACAVLLAGVVAWAITSVWSAALR